MFFITSTVFADQAPNPRSGNAVNSTVSNTNSSQRSSGRNVIQVINDDNINKNLSARNAVNEVSRSATQRSSATISRSATVSEANKNVVNASRSAIKQNVVPVNSATTSRAGASNVVRSAVSHDINNASSSARSASKSTVIGLGRSATARATAVFSDVSKIGSGYANCREAYATCMDQLCANANDTYRRCFCSSKYTEIRDTEAALDQALSMLASFEDNNLNAVDKTAEEVAAMYSATEGELAIKKDTSAAATMLAEIGDLLSGKKKADSTDSTNVLNSLDSLSFEIDMEDIWSNSGADSIFGTGNTGVDLSSLEGEALYNEANKSCLQIIADSCENNAVLTMAKSAYSIMITQDCNAYNKTLNSKKENVEQTVRTAEKYLREARLEEYRAHNSADVNECITSVKNAITADSACGANYKRCLDYTGAYVNQNTGEPIYSPRLFQLGTLMTLDGTSSDVIGQNANFNSFLDEKRISAESALDTCRDISDIVWEEFKRQALIEIAQAQDNLIEEVKMSCVSTIADCYDTQSGQLKDFDTNTAKYSGAVSALAAKAMCEEKVIACAALYGNTDGCSFDSNGKLSSKNAANETCGLEALLNFVDTVDKRRISEGCITAVESYVKDLCTPTSGTYGYPWNCRDKELGDFNKEANGGYNASLVANIKEFVENNCGASYEEASSEIQFELQNFVNNFSEDMAYLLAGICEDYDGVWVDANDDTGDNLAVFYSRVYGGKTEGGKSWGRCVENTTKVQCLYYNDSDKSPVATYDAVRDECTFTDDWYREKCSSIRNGYYENGFCYVAP